MKKLLSLLLALLCCLTPSAALADVSFDGSVVSGGAISVRAPFGGVVTSCRYRRATASKPATSSPRSRRPRSTRSDAGTVTGLFVQPGDNAETRRRPLRRGALHRP